MDDTLRYVAIGLGAFLAFHFALDSRAHRDAVRQVAQSFGNTGSVRVQLNPSGPLGLELNDYASVDIAGEHERSAHIPFFVFPKQGWKGSIHHLRLRLRDYTLAGLPIELFEADLPHVSYDVGHAIYRGRLVLRGAGAGPAHVHLSSADLSTFILKKYQKTLSDVLVVIDKHEIVVNGRLRVFGILTAFQAIGGLKVRSGRFIDLMQPSLELDGKPVDPSLAASILSQINPVLDTFQDLGLSGFFDMKSVTIGDSEVVIDGIATLPRAAEGTRPP